MVVDRRKGMDYNRKPNANNEEPQSKGRVFFKHAGLIALALVLAALTVVIISLNKYPIV